MKKNTANHVISVILLIFAIVAIATLSAAAFKERPDADGMSGNCFKVIFGSTKSPKVAASWPLIIAFCLYVVGGLLSIPTFFREKSKGSMLIYLIGAICFVAAGILFLMIKKFADPNLINSTIVGPGAGAISSSVFAFLAAAMGAIGVLVNRKKA